MFLTNVYAPEHKWSPMYPTFIQLWSAMIQWYSLFFFGLGNLLLETYKEEGLEERGMNRNEDENDQRFFKFDCR